jgi:hypothetical protein
MWVIRLAVTIVALSMFAQPLAADAVAAKRPARVAGINWGGGHFRGQHALKSWLSKRGIDYHLWLRRHPRGLYLMTHAPPAKAATPRVAPTPATTTVPTTRTAGAAPPADSATRATPPADHARWAAVGLYSAALLLLLLALLPESAVQRLRIPAGKEAGLRVGAASVAASAAAGATVALILGS